MMQPREIGRRSNYNSLDAEDRGLLDAAEEAMNTAYDPYSRFQVGAALRTYSGEIITGSNYANASSGATICAERSAIVAANGLKHRTFRALAVIARGADFDTPKVTAPCGICRQVIYEARQIGGEDIRVILSTTRKDQILVTSIDELLPLGFGPVDLGIDVSGYKR